MKSKQYGNEKIIQLNIEAANRRHYDEIHPFVMIVSDNPSLVIEYINRPIFGIEAKRVQKRSLFEVYQEHASKVVQIFDDSRQLPREAIHYTFDMPTAKGLARFSEQCVYLDEKFYVSGTFIGMY